MHDALYQEFLDWLRRRDVVVLRTESGEMLATGFRPRSVFEEYDAHVRRKKAIVRDYVTSLGLLRQWHGAAVDEFLTHLSVGDGPAL